jgi:hypothetical protein
LNKVKFVRMRVILWSRKRKSYLNRDFLVVLFLLAARGAIRDKPFLLSAVALDKIGSIVAYLAISWAKVGDLNPRAETGYIAL